MPDHIKPAPAFLFAAAAGRALTLRASDERVSAGTQGARSFIPEPDR